jgi:acyl transferase domain-containing protein
MARVEAESISYVEAHGTGTPVGDPIEIAALTKCFRAGTAKKRFCAIGSVKTNIGHLDTAAGIAGLIKTALALKHKLIPPSLHFEQPNPEIDFDRSPFYVNAALTEWKAGATPRRAGVSSFGLGGTNVHIVLEEAPNLKACPTRRSHRLLFLSAKRESSLERMAANLADYLKRNPNVQLDDVAYTLHVGRRRFDHRRAVICTDAPSAVQAIENGATKPLTTYCEQRTAPPIVFMFPGQGAQYQRMGIELYESEPEFRRQLDTCSELLRPHLKLSVADLLYGLQKQGSETSRFLSQTWIAQPAIFAVEYGLAKLWMKWGIHPGAMIGHSLGEYVAACLAGVLSLEDALYLVTVRGRLMQELPEGAMLAVTLSEGEVTTLLGDELSLAAINGPARCVVSGPLLAIEELQRSLSKSGVDSRLLHTSHAFHSQMVDPVLPQLAPVLESIRLNTPAIPYVSNVTGRWITAEEATSVNHWLRHMRQPVRFAEGLAEVSTDPSRILLEVGPGQTLCTLARQQKSIPAGRMVLSSLGHPNLHQSETASILTTLGQLWLAGVQVDEQGFYGDRRPRRIPLPTYAFERKRCWIEPARIKAQNKEETATSASASLIPEAPSANGKTISPAGWRRAAVSSISSVARIVQQQMDLLSEQLAILDQVGKSTGRTVVNSTKSRGPKPSGPPPS